MICTECKYEADVVLKGIYTHEDIAERNREYCNSSDPVGHAGCTAGGCGCQHRRARINVGDHVTHQEHAGETGTVSRIVYLHDLKPWFRVTWSSDTGANVLCKKCGRKTHLYIEDELTHWRNA